MGSDYIFFFLDIYARISGRQRFSDEEYEIMLRHVHIGREALRGLECVSYSWLRMPDRGIDVIAALGSTKTSHRLPACSALNRSRYKPRGTLEQPSAAYQSRSPLRRLDSTGLSSGQPRVSSAASGRQAIITMFRRSAWRLAASVKAAAEPSLHTIQVSKAQGVAKGLTGGKSCTAG